MAGDRGLAFVMIGLIGTTIVWVASSGSHSMHVAPATTVYAAARKAPHVKNAPMMHLPPSSGASFENARVQLTKAPAR